jgi:hypothetical protein
MWSTVLLMAIVAGADPVRLGAVVFMLSRTRPMRMLLAYFIAGFTTNLVVGAVVLFGLRDTGLGSTGSVPGEVEIAIGLFALVVGALVVCGFPARVRRRVGTRHPKGGGADADRAATAVGRPGLQRPSFTKLPTPAQAALQSESLWIAGVVGLGMGVPTAYYLAAIAAILTSGAAAGSQVGALLVFNLLGFAVAEIPVVSFSVAPEATRAYVDQLYAWMKAHHRLVVATLAGMLGMFLILLGSSNL